MKSQYVVFRATALFALSGVWAVQAAGAAFSAEDNAFVAKVSQGGMFEVEAGKLAADQGSTQDVKDQGSTEAHDHKLVGDKLMAIASASDVKLPATLNASFQMKLDDLKGLSGTAFDTAYLHAMADVHAKDGAAFAKEASAGGNADLKAFAVETHRIVVRHIGELKAQP